MDLKIFHDTVRYFLNKEQGGWLSPEEIDNLCDRAQMWYFTSCVPFFGKNQKDTDPLTVFHTRLDFVTGSNGVITLPTDPLVNPCFETLPSVTVSYYDTNVFKTRYKPVKLLSADEITERRDSQILEPTVINPVGTETGKGTIQLYPEAAMAGFVTYLRRPLKPIYVYTPGGRDVSTSYNASTSTQLEWPESSINKILVKVIQMAGVNISDELIIQYTEQKNAQDI
jgi:hypothetical protein